MSKASLPLQPCHLPLAHILNPSKELEARRQQKFTSACPPCPMASLTVSKQEIPSSRSQCCHEHGSWFYKSTFHNEQFSMEGSDSWRTRKENFPLLPFLSPLWQRCGKFLSSVRKGEQKTPFVSVSLFSGAAWLPHGLSLCASRLP